MNDNWLASGDWRRRGGQRPRPKAQKYDRATRAQALEAVRGVLEWFAEKLTDEDILGEDGKVDPTYEAAALEYIATYDGNFDYMVDLRAKAQRFDPSVGQLRGALNVLRAEVQRKAQAREPMQVVGEPVPDGTYTIVFPDGRHKTLRLRAATRGNDLPKGTQVAAYLSGPDNERSFTSFGFVTGRAHKVWRRFAESAELSEALGALLKDDNFRDAGEAYAMASGRCCRCAHKLTVPASLHRGMGPDCAAREAA